MKKKANNSRYKPTNVTVEVEYMPFPSEEKRLEAYSLHVKLWLRAKERRIRRMGENRKGVEKLVK